MKATVKISIEIEISLQTEKDASNTSILELEVKASSLGTCLFDTIKHSTIHEILNKKLDGSCKATITDVSSIKNREIIL